MPYACSLMGERWCAHTDNVIRLNATGSVTQIYNPTSKGETLFALNLDPDGKSFWTGGLSSGNIYRFDIDSGKILKKLSSVGNSIGGLIIKGEITVGTEVCGDNVDNNKNGIVDEGCNIVPTAEAGIDGTVDENSTVILNGESSKDIDGNITSYTWKQVSGPHNVTLVNATSIHPSFIAPFVNSSGEDLAFELEVTDNNNANDTDTVTFHVRDIGIGLPQTPSNLAPMAKDDTFTTEEDTPVFIPVLANDTDADGDNSCIDSVKLQAINGSSVINSNGTITYSPNANFFGSDGFNYTITDGRGGNATARVSVSVNSVNDPPLPSNDIANTFQDRPVVIDVLANDTDPEGDALVISAISNPPSNGTAIINNNGTITFSSPTGFSGSDTFDYQVSDGNGGNSTASVLVNVISAVNRPPVVTISSPINGSQFMQGDPVAFSGSATDPEDGNISSVMTWESSIDGPLGIGPNIIASSLSQGVHTITASAIDSAQLSNSSSIDISVNVAGNQPPVAVGDQFKTNEDTPLNMNVIANDTDPDNDQLPVTGLAQNPNNGQANINNINNTITYAPNPNFNGQDSFVYKISDGKGGNSSALVSIEVLAVNDNPIAKSDIVITDQGKPIIIDVLANDSDIDNDQLTISQVTSPTDGNTVIENSKVKLHS